ncbi:transcriptional regulator, TetR family protein [Pusillimonas sp. T7-7]|jgi:AcrR family transcriptional regulator|uniref:TetR/AcrR family transcriptional regulator n=1 Tax=Pusillimonas sp. (strain T7-7) TaxID=1007105 RepID=UPI0002084B83|nr:TetR/AcrR family transcriptional regulator [Pusillimonas sp. T7-7]AEC21112.1 transcriptional regulator, TetR family protein [Pusillimonas sp. T7-7]
MQERRSNVDRSQETRGALLNAARSLFFEKGYAVTGTPEVVERAGVTRGALYHHFKDKQALFQAVVESEASQIAKEIEAKSFNAETPMKALLHGAKAYFQAMRQPGRVRLMLLEGPAVLGPDEMRRIDLQTGGRELRCGIRDALGPDTPSAEVDACADLISAMFDRAALACDVKGGNKTYEDVIATLLSTLVRERSQNRASSKTQ